MNLSASPRADARSPPSAGNAALLKFARFAISRSDHDALARAIALDVRTVSSRTELIAAGSAHKTLPIMLNGWACCYRTLDDGEQMLVACYLPGDVCDFHSLLGARPNTLIVLLAGAQIARLSRETLARLNREHPGVIRALWCEAQIASSIEREWLVNIGRRVADARIAHLLCEFMTRFELVGQFRDDRLAMPLTQADLAAACGLTTAHTNRILRRFREDGLIVWRNRTLQALDRRRLEKFAAFRPAYLTRASQPQSWTPHLHVPV